MYEPNYFGYNVLWIDELDVTYISQNKGRHTISDIFVCVQQNVTYSAIFLHGF